ncbi:hypothetical protein GGU10DRAFT_379671 [Lentinula aff. detonsa]|uniref:CCHC-type domain-containing protein n=1 Tax=Lentinula aff. detonsa TaxID=2804958 RepID=A0AA38NNR8_9AGAR|nr:hypothetical protein GGU10DRAFT_379671 [Lentinula aff. detonsa]
MSSHSSMLPNLISFPEDCYDHAKFNPRGPDDHFPVHSTLTGIYLSVWSFTPRTYSLRSNLFPTTVHDHNKDRQLVGLSNWAVFRDHLHSVARATGLTGYLLGTIVAPSPIVLTSPSPGGTTVPPLVAAPTLINARTPSLEEWELRDGRLAGIIYQNVKDPRSITLTELMTTHEMWTQLTNEFDTSSAAAQALAKEQIQQFRYSLGTPFEEYFPKYLWVIQNHGSQLHRDLKHVLIEYDMMVESALPSTSSTPIPNALAARSSTGGVVCDNCQRSGHIKKDCWAKGGGSEGKAPCWYNAPKGMEPFSKSVSAALTINVPVPNKHLRLRPTSFKHE